MMREWRKKKKKKKRSSSEGDDYDKEDGDEYDENDVEEEKEEEKEEEEQKGCTAPRNETNLYNLMQCFYHFEIEAYRILEGHQEKTSPITWHTSPFQAQIQCKKHHWSSTFTYP